MAVNEEFKTKAQIAYEYLRSLIMSGELQAGSRVLITDVAKALGFSQTPVREAVRELVSRGTLVLSPHVGVMVPEYSIETVEELFEIRAVLEGLATRLNAPYISDDGYAYLDGLIEKSRACAEKSDFLGYGALDKQFHFYIYKAGPYEHLYEMITDLWDRNARFGAVFRFCRERMFDSADEHEEVLKAIRCGNLELGEQLMRKHKRAAGKVYVAYVRQIREDQAKGGEKLGTREFMPSAASSQD